MSSKFDSFFNDMCADIKPKEVDMPDTIDMKKLGEQMQEEVKKAFQNVSVEEILKQKLEAAAPDAADVEDDVNNLNDNNEEDL